VFGECCFLLGLLYPSAVTRKARETQVGDERFYLLWTRLKWNGYNFNKGGAEGLISYYFCGVVEFDDKIDPLYHTVYSSKVDYG